jgi:hypothetical protein
MPRCTNTYNVLVDQSQLRFYISIKYQEVDKVYQVRSVTLGI